MGPKDIHSLDGLSEHFELCSIIWTLQVIWPIYPTPSTKMQQKMSTWRITQLVLVRIFTGAMKTIWASPLIGNNKIRIFNMTLEPVHLYGAETWWSMVITKKMIQTFISIYPKECSETASLRLPPTRNSRNQACQLGKPKKEENYTLVDPHPLKHARSIKRASVRTNINK